MKPTSTRRLDLARVIRAGALGLAMLLPITASAAGWTNVPAKIVQLLVMGDGTAYVVLDQTTVPQVTNTNACTAPFTFTYRLGTTTGDVAKAILAQLQLAYAMRVTVSIFSGGCTANLNSIDGVQSF